MKTHWVFKAKKMNECKLCYFYCVGSSRHFPAFPTPCESAAHDMLKKLLEAARMAKCTNLLMAYARDLAMAVCLLQELHDRDSMKCLVLEPKPDMDGKPVKKLSFCPFFLYHGSNDISYMNHIVSTHYNAAYGCGKCLKLVFLSGQQLKMHLKVCAGFPKNDTPSSSNWECMLPSAQDNPCPSSKHSKETKLGSAKESSYHSKSHKKSQKKSTEWEDAPKKDKQNKDQPKSKKSHKK